MSSATVGYPGGYPPGPNPGPGMGPGLSAHPGDTSARDFRYETPRSNQPGHAHFGFTGASGPPPSGFSAPSASSYRRWTPGSTQGGPPGGPTPGYGTQPGSGFSSRGPGGTGVPSPAGPHTGGSGFPPGVLMRGAPLEHTPGSGYATGAVAGPHPGGYVPGDGGPSRPSPGLAAPRRAPSAAPPPPSYDVVHLSARNARLEEKLSKALAKNRSMAKYYDQLLAKTRDAQEREVDGLKETIERLTRQRGDGVDADVLRNELRAEQTKRAAVERELMQLRAQNDGRVASTSEEFANTAAALRVATDQLAARDAELAMLREATRAAQSESSSAVAVDGRNNSTLSQMRELLDRAREDQRREREDAERRDAEMARQLTEIKEQALERIRESTAAAREVATLRERCHASELERDRLRDKVEELEYDERDHRELRRMARDAEHAAKAAREKADRCELAEARLRQEQAHVASLRDERAQAHARTQEMTERLLNVTNEKDVLVRHSARQVHVEAELANAKEELERFRQQSLTTRAEAKETTSVWRDGAEGLGRVLRAHIYGHARWERDVSDECSGALEAHEHAQRSTVRLVAAAEQEAAGLAGEAIEAVRVTRQLLAEYGAKSKAVLDEIQKTAQKHANERVEAALSMLRNAEMRAEAAEADSAAAQADARRAHAPAARAGVLPSALAVPEAAAGAASADRSGPESSNDVVSGRIARSSANPAFRRALRERQFQMFGLALWKRAAARDGARDASFLRGQLELARRETRVALTRRERSERLSDRRGVRAKWGILFAGALRADDKERRARARDVEDALRTTSRILRACASERDAATEALRGADAEMARLVRALDALRLEHDDALRRLQHERGLRGELGMLAPGRIPGDEPDDAFLDAPSVAATRKAMDALFDAAKSAVALAKTATEDAQMETDESVAKAQLEDTLRACHDALLIIADEDERAARLAEAERERAAFGAEPPSSASSSAVALRLDAQNAAASMNAATRRVQRRALEVKAELLAALLDGIAARRDAAVAKRLAGAPAERGSETAAARVMRFARVSREQQIRDGSLRAGPPTETRADAANLERFETRAPEPEPKRETETETVLDAAVPAARVGPFPNDPDSVQSSVAAGADAFSDPDQFSSAQAARRSRPKVVHSPPAKARALRAQEAAVARGGGVSFDEDPSERSYASLVRARARRAEALAARSVNDGTLEEMRAASRGSRGASPAGDEKERRGGDAGNRKRAATKHKQWTPPPWDERPLRKSDEKSRGVTDLYASEPTRAKGARR